MSSKTLFQKAAFCLALVALIGTSMAQSKTPTHLVLDNPDYTDTIKTFRSPQWQQAGAPQAMLVGVDKLNISASGQFSENTLVKTLKGQTTKNITVVDLRMESHGFVDGQAISWYGKKNANNATLSHQELLVRENDKLSKLQDLESFEVGKILHKRSGTILKVELLNISPTLIETEETMVKRHGFNYVRMPVLDRNPPSNMVVDDFVKMVKELPEDDWLHLHCRAGKGRATTFMVIYDIVKNGKDMTLDNIFERQAFFGKKDLRKLPWKPEKLWKLEPAKERLKLLQQFYEYRNSAHFDQMPWSEWVVTKAT